MGCGKRCRMRIFLGFRVQRFKVQGFKVQGFKSSRVQGFKGSTRLELFEHFKSFELLIKTINKIINYNECI